MQKEEYILKISGKVLQKKTREFEQTITFIFNQLPPDCEHRSLILPPSGDFELSTTWQSVDGMIAFKSSPEFELLKGALDTMAENFKFSQKAQESSHNESHEEKSRTKGDIN